MKIRHKFLISVTLNSKYEKYEKYEQYEQYEKYEKYEKYKKYKKYEKYEKYEKYDPRIQGQNINQQLQNKMVCSQNSNLNG